MTPRSRRSSDSSRRAAAWSPAWIVALRRVRQPAQRISRWPGSSESSYRGPIEASAGRARTTLDVNFAKSIGPDYWEKRKNVFDFKQDTSSFLNQGKMPTYVGDGRVTFKGPAVRVVTDEPGCRVVGTLRVKSGEGNAVDSRVWSPTHLDAAASSISLAGFDAAYYLYAYPYQRLLLKNAIDWAAPSPSPIDVEAPMCVHSTLMRQSNDGRSGSSSTSIAT